MSKTGEENGTFWDHLDALRSILIRIVIVTLTASCICFCFKDELFDVVLAPSSSDFFVYKWMGGDPFSLTLINTELTEQFMIHLKVAFMAGVLIASPYIIYALFKFISPALYQHERKYSTRIVLSAYLMFLLGTAVNYLSIFPVTVNFLGTYQVSEKVANMLTISSYIDTLVMMSMVFGIMFEIPIISWLLARFGLLRGQWMTKYRRHAIVAILVVSAIITPTSDAFTLALVSLPIWGLYEASIFIVKATEKKKK